VAATKNKVKGASATEMKTASSFLFVWQVKQGKIETQDGKTYLVLKKTDVHYVMIFSDRPYRIVKIITGKDFQKIWKTGKDSFEKDPLNAVLSLAGEKAQIVILGSIHVKGDEIRMRLHAVVAVMGLRDITVTIDNDSGILAKFGNWMNIKTNKNDKDNIGAIGESSSFLEDCGSAFSKCSS